MNDNAKDKAKESIEKAGEAVKESVGKAGAAIDDSAHKVKSEFKKYWCKFIEIANKKYHFAFDINGWIIGIIGLILLVLLLT